MQIRLILRTSGGALVYGIHPLFRAALGAIAAVLALAMAVGGPSALGAALMLLSLLGALYEERWTFDPSTGNCAGRIGFVFAAKGPKFKAEDVAALWVDLFVKGRLDQSEAPPENKMPPGSQARLIAELKSGESFLVDSVPFRRKRELEEAAARIMTAMGIVVDPDRA